MLHLKIGCMLLVQQYKEINLNIIEQVYAATVLWWAGLDKFPIANPHSEGFLLPKFRRDNAKNQNSSAMVGLSHCYSRQKLTTLLSGFFMLKI